MSRWTACTWTTPLASYDSPTSTVTSASVGVDAGEDVLAEDRAIERTGALALRQVDLEPGVGPAVRRVEVASWCSRAGIGMLRRITMSLT